MDITAGAILVSMLFCKELNVSFLWQEMTLLGLSVWIVYSIDHILDVKRDRHSWRSERRRFHFSIERVLTVGVILAVSVAIILLFFISQQLLIWGLGLTLTSSLYFLISHRVEGIKEFFGALIYTMGVVLIPMLNAPFKLILTPTFLLFLLASLNLILFSFLDRHIDKQEGMPSFACAFGFRNTRGMIMILAALLAIGIVYFVVSDGSYLLSIFFALGFFSHVLIFIHSWFHDFDRFKILGDLTFVLSGLLLLV